MTYQSKEELFRLYLEGKITALKKQQRTVLDKLVAAEFGTDEFFSATHEYDYVGKKLTTFNQVKRQFDSIFRKAES